MTSSAVLTRGGGTDALATDEDEPLLVAGVTEAGGGVEVFGVAAAGGTDGLAAGAGTEARGGAMNLENQLSRTRMYHP